MLVATDKEIELARLLAVAYLLGYKADARIKIPETTSEMMRHGNDGLNWQKFLPLAKDILKQEEEDEPRRPDQEGTSPTGTL